MTYTSPLISIKIFGKYFEIANSPRQSLEEKLEELELENNDLWWRVDDLQYELKEAG